MFARFFGADADRDGFLSQDEMKRVLDAAPSKSTTTAAPAKAKTP